MIRKEIHRIMIKDKILFVIILFVLFKIISSINLEYEYSWKSESETKFYIEYMKEITGEVTEWKKEKIEDDYNNDKIRANHHDAMEQVYMDYQYALEDTEKHFFLADDSIELVMLHLEIDWLLIFIIILIATSLVIKEYTTGVIQIVQTSKKGRMLFSINKTLIMLVVVTIVSSIFQIIPLLVCGLRYGFSSANAPVQSIQMFESYSGDMTLIEAWIYVSVLRIIAYMIYGMLIFSIASICKKTTSLFFIGISSVFFPTYILSGNYHQEKIYHSFIPMGNLKGDGFLLGNIKFESEVEYYFVEIGKRELIEIFLLQFLIAIMFISIALIRISGLEIKCMNKKVKNLGIILVLLASVCCGCSNEDAREFRYIQMTGRENVTNSYIKIDEYTYYDKKEKTIYSIAETVIDTEKILAIGDSYIMVARQEINGAINADYVIELLNTESRERYSLIRFGKNVDTDALLGLDKVIDLSMLVSGDETITNMGINETVVYENNNLFFSYNNLVIKADCISKEYSVIYYASEMKNTTISNGQIYYIDGNGELLQYSISDKKTKVIFEAVENFWLGENKIYTTMKDVNGLFLLEIGGCGDVESTKISDITPEVVDEYQDIVVFQQENNIVYIDLSEDNYLENKIDIYGRIAGICNRIIYLYNYDEDEMKILEYEIK